MKASLYLVCQVMDFEPVESGNELVGRPFGAVLRVDHEEHVREARAEVGPVRVMVAGRLGGVHVHALRTVEFNHGFCK